MTAPDDSSHDWRPERQHQKVVLLSSEPPPTSKPAAMRSPGYRACSVRPRTSPWLQIWLQMTCWRSSNQNDQGYLPRSMAGAPGGTRTPGPLLRRHTLTVARRRWVWPGRLFSCGDGGWTWLGIARCLPSLAPHLAPCNTAAPGVHRRRWPRPGWPARLARSLGRTSAP